MAAMNIGRHARYSGGGGPIGFEPEDVYERRHRAEFFLRATIPKWLHARRRQMDSGIGPGGASHRAAEVAQIEIARERIARSAREVVSHVQNVETRTCRRSSFAWCFSTGPWGHRHGAGPSQSADFGSLLVFGCSQRGNRPTSSLLRQDCAAALAARPRHFAASEHCLQPSGQGICNQPLGLGHLLDNARPLPLRRNFK